ncbi:MAG: ABC transporter ATP-binding protein [Candidatus Marinimicrobia bacterium]|nr:ABC transporter ATP-binding protein [Candidatus Neomarinimicrobiota bacterium]
MEASITLKKVGKLAGGRTILAGMSFGVERGSLVAIIGDNDSGKSTLLHVLAGYEKPDYGNVYVHGLDMVKRRAETCRVVAYVPHEPDFDPWLSIEQNIHFIGALHKIPQEKLDQRIAGYSQRLGIEHYLNVTTGDLSLGIQKRALIVRTLVQEPQILILDEPTAFMDADAKRMVWEILSEMREGRTIIYASQDLREVELANDRILVLHNGHMVLDGTLEKLLATTNQYHQFRVEFEKLSDDLYQELSRVPTVVNPSRVGNTFHFYGRSRRVFFHVLKKAADAVMTDFHVSTLGLKDLMDTNYARKGLE